MEKSNLLVYEIKRLDDFDLEILFFGNVPDIKKLKFTLDKIINNIKKVNKIPIDRRHFDF